MNSSREFQSRRARGKVTFHSPLCCLSFAFCAVVVVVLGSVVPSAQGISPSPPTLRLFQVDAANKIVKVLSVEGSQSEIVLDEGISSLRLECVADYPIQILYSGNGIPLMESSITSSSATEFKATAFIQRVREQHTGKYKCASTESPNILSYVYIYVPGPVLFNTNSGKQLDVSSTSVQIPCTASSPRVSVYLQKPVGDPLERPGEYDPRRGFLIYVERIEKAQGVYLCKANYRGVTNVLEYKVNVVAPGEPNSNQRDEGLRPMSVVESANQKSEFDDEPPCNPPCSQNAKCVLQAGGRRSVCQCLAPFKGDPYGSCEAECSTHTDCPDQYSCFADYKCRDPCVSSLHGLQCGRNAVCKTVNHRPTCACPKGTNGDPFKSCDSSSNSFQGDAPSISTERTRTTPITTPTSKRPSGGGKQPSNSSPPRRNNNKCRCGPENEDCECICVADSDCDDGKFCNGTVCMNPCDGLCGIQALCTPVNGVGYCSCPKGYRGDPWKRCSPIITIEKSSGDKDTDTDRQKQGPSDKEKVIDFSSAFSSFAPTSSDSDSDSGSNCQSDADCPTKYVCDLEKSKTCVDPCINCAENAECDLWDGAPRPHCRCPEGYTGDGINFCYQDVTFELTGVKPGNLNLHQEISNKACSNTSCGQHSECRITPEGLPKCNCISGYVGEPPKCRVECSQHTDCRDNQLCVLKKCRSICAGKCGRFARCTVDKETRTHSCRCRAGFEGDPLVECVKKAK